MVPSGKLSKEESYFSGKTRKQNNGRRRQQAHFGKVDNIYFIRESSFIALYWILLLFLFTLTLVVVSSLLWTQKTTSMLEELCFLIRMTPSALILSFPPLMLPAVKGCASTRGPHSPPPEYSASSPSLYSSSRSLVGEKQQNQEKEEDDDNKELEKVNKKMASDAEVVGAQQQHNKQEYKNANTDNSMSSSSSTGESSNSAETTSLRRNLNFFLMMTTTTRSHQQQKLSATTITTTIESSNTSNKNNFVDEKQSSSRGNTGSLAETRAPKQREKMAEKTKTSENETEKAVVANVGGESMKKKEKLGNSNKGMMSIPSLFLRLPSSLSDAETAVVGRQKKNREEEFSPSGRVGTTSKATKGKDLININRSYQQAASPSVSLVVLRRRKIIIKKRKEGKRKSAHQPSRQSRTHNNQNSNGSESNSSEIYEETSSAAKKIELESVEKTTSQPSLVDDGEDNAEDLENVSPLTTTIQQQRKVEGDQNSPKIRRGEVEQGSISSSSSSSFSKSSSSSSSSSSTETSIDVDFSPVVVEQQPVAPEKVIVLPPPAAPSTITTNTEETVTTTATQELPSSPVVETTTTVAVPIAETTTNATLSSPSPPTAITTSFSPPTTTTMSSVPITTTTPTTTTSTTTTTTTTTTPFVCAPTNPMFPFSSLVEFSTTDLSSGQLELGNVVTTNFCTCIAALPFQVSWFNGSSSTKQPDLQTTTSCTNPCSCDMTQQPPICSAQSAGTTITLLTDCTTQTNPCKTSVALGGLQAGQTFIAGNSVFCGGCPSGTQLQVLQSCFCGCSSPPVTG